MSSDQLMNVQADKLETSALIAAIKENKFIKSVFLLEKVVICILGNRVIGSPKEDIAELWDKQVAMELFHQQKIICKKLFPLIYWEGMSQVMRSFPFMFQTWITKQVAHFSHWDKTVTNRCPNCKYIDESTSHITSQKL
jgi:hypothetical protein